MSTDVPSKDDVREAEEPAEPSPPRRHRGRTIAIVLAPVVLFALLLATGLGKDPRALPSEEPSTVGGGPAQVSTPAYREGWGAIFGGTNTRRRRGPHTLN